LDQLTPILPDPYAADLSAFEYPVSLLVAAVGWSTPSSAELAFSIQSSSSARAAGQRSAELAEPRAIPRDAVRALYDVSSAQSQFGVVVGASALRPGEIVGQQLVASGEASGLFTVPAIAWEPVLDPNRSWFFNAVSSDDGDVAVVGVLTPALRAV